MLFERRINTYLILGCVLAGIIMSVVGNNTLVQQFVVLLWSLTMFLVALRLLWRDNYRLARRRFIWFLTLTLTITLICSILELIYLAKYDESIDPFLIIFASSLRIGLFSYGWFELVYNLSHRQKVTGQTIALAIIAYLFIAVIWFYLYLIVWHLNPQAFHIAEIAEYKFQPWNLAMYFSLVTITTVGYGGIIPLERWMMVIATFEAILGAFYLTVIVARLVSLFSISD